ncbi:alpha-amylase [Vibrio hippocampi]|uniref:Periplasmic alpha-amylase n=1 Tax=Vibrio hippocampi TaxID=654686 RepID=A0ABM8ZKC9_9VIBR|nr:alpha-amylase [Vibrio hippocampi]CAH0526651.1 Periplasmic alpha-amylase [Vibrio hippocampi]
MKLATTALLLTSVLLTSVSALADPNITISTGTTSRDYPLNSEQPLVVSLVKDAYRFKVVGVTGDCTAPQSQKIKFSSPIALDCQQPTEFDIKIRFSGDYALTFDNTQQTLKISRASKKRTENTFKRPIPKVECQVYNGGEVSIALDDSFTEGTSLREVFSGKQVVVQNQQVTLTPSPTSGGMILLERLDATHQPNLFNYRNANIYFVMVDRFNNGEPSNDHSYGRRSDGQQEIGTFHGGDLKGVIAKLDYIQSLGTDAIWLSPIVEQVHGFVGGGDSGSFPFYAYHGYWTRDFTKVDENFGNDDDLKRLVEAAHQRGIKVLLDAVINHPGYATLADLQFDGVDTVTHSDGLSSRWQDWQPKQGQNWHSFHQHIDYNHTNWSQWWGKDWVRAGLPGYPSPGSSDTTLTLAGLPDFLTESDKGVTPPQWLLENPGTRVVARDNYSVADYLIEWQTDWVKRFGIDGYRVDTVKHVEGEVWQRLKQQASLALDEWRAERNKHGEPFWMMGEVWGHTAYRSPYFDDGFDALINFDMQKKLDKGAACFSQMADTYQDYANTIASSEDFNPVSYMSSHDTELFFSRFNQLSMQRNAANALLLSPGAVQVYYGDEVGRPIGPYADDFHQGTRSAMIWQLDQERQALLEHWQTLGQFRQRHPSVGAGLHREIPQANAYVFSRTLADDTIVAAFVGHKAKP